MSNDTFNEEYVNRLKAMEEAINTTKTPMAQDSIRIAKRVSDQQPYKNHESIQSISSQVTILSTFAKNCFKVLFSEDISKQYSKIARMMSDTMRPIAQLYSYDHMANSLKCIERALENCRWMYYYPDGISSEEATENEAANSKIITEIFRSEEENNKDIHKRDPAIITLSPINDVVLKYLSENPRALYQLTSRKFEEVMAEIYNRLGYKVKLTKQTRDGGKDIILRKPDILGDFIYYVECKKYAPSNPIGVGIVREFSGVINMDKVNGGIIATTSYFSEGAREMIMNYNLGFQIQMHDYDKIRELLNQVV